MPYKTKKDRRAYDKQYNVHKAKQRKALDKALTDGDLAKARKILARKPKIHVKKRGKRRKK